MITIFIYIYLYLSTLELSHNTVNIISKIITCTTITVHLFGNASLHVTKPGNCSGPVYYAPDRVKEL